MTLGNKRLRCSGEGHRSPNAALCRGFRPSFQSASEMNATEETHVSFG